MTRISECVAQEVPEFQVERFRLLGKWRMAGMGEFHYCRRGQRRSCLVHQRWGIGTIVGADEESYRHVEAAREVVVA